MNLPIEFVNALIGGTLIGASATVLLLMNGRIAGISGIFNSALRSFDAQAAWRWAFLISMSVGAFAYQAITCAIYTKDVFSPTAMILGGIFVGIGTRWGSGCTSGHGVCGLGRLSMRSLVATLTFLVVAIITTTIIRHVLGLSS